MGIVLRMLKMNVFFLLQCGRLFGSFKSKDGAPKSPAHTAANNELQVQVDTEKKKNVKLQEQIEKMRQENYQLAAEGEYSTNNLQFIFVTFLLYNVEIALKFSFCCISFIVLLLCMFYHLHFIFEKFSNSFWRI